MRFRVVYGGQKWIEADTEGDAYAQFWAWLREQIDQGRVGLAIPEDAEEDAG